MKQHPEHYSSVAAFMECQMKYYLSHKYEGFGVRKTGYKSIAMSFGYT